MLDRLIDLVVQFVDAFKFVTIVYQYERGVRMRFGKNAGKVEPGLHFYWPLGIEHIITHHIVPDTWETHPLSFTTADGHACAAAAVILYKVHDIEKALLETNDPRVACSMACGLIVSEAMKRTWNEIINPTFAEHIVTEVRKRSFRYGVEVSEVRFTDLAKIKSLRLMSAQH